IGENALKVIDNHADRLKIFGLSAHKNAERLIQQAKDYQAKFVCIADDSQYQEVKQALKDEDIRVMAGRNGLLRLASN
ncbi:MAG: 1-deoxy-D-xylulose-5-phosphate reductoisomerase, partial [candidate division Zixibacteria bacterium]|nr:1-deoxy-D-xylulose-5-phosphate reductoisomerase [candidate division Zixibacteria bacterium]NIW40976.1 1-deoxy-D-xylulose-5-phosphate reductoisomerase [candidate division Zixibacteria bacterium]NIX55031.1 1-deoxy-D-xylulose-5-phosphate reductoisomerase [candidate division Zixibacteria bacterium]